MAKRTRGNGKGSLFQRTDGCSWIASWYGADGKRIERSTRTTSKADAERIARKWVERSVLEREGLVAPVGGTALDRHAAASIESHLDAFNATKRAEGRTDRHIAETATMIRAAADGCGWKVLGDISVEHLERYIGRKRAPAKKDGEKPPRPWTPRTAHKYITALRTFTRWCVADGRLAADPLARVKKPAPIRQRSRRMLMVEEWRWLRSVTEDGPERLGMDGHSRRLLYELAIQTGLRSSELRSLTRTSLMLDAKRPYVLLEAKHTKNRKAARQYLRPELAADLTQYLTRSMPGTPIFSMPRRESVATMLRSDLEAARSVWLDAVGTDAAERTEREGADFLRVEDHDGRVLDFHALRHTCGSWAAIGGASPKAIQTLMRHSSITLTLDTYGHLLPDEAAETVGRMPVVEPIELRLTGTDDENTEKCHSMPDDNYAVDYATAAQSGAKQGDGVRWGKNKNAPGDMPEAVVKRGGRESNPQPPDRQSGAQKPTGLETQGLTSEPIATPAVDYATAGDPGPQTPVPTPPLVAADPGLAGVVAAWVDLPEAIRVGIVAMVEAATPKGGNR